MCIRDRSMYEDPENKPRDWFVCHSCGHLAGTPLKLRKHRKRECRRGLCAKYEAHRLMEWLRVFNEIDEHGRGALDRKAVDGLIRRANPEVRKEESARIFEEMDQDEDGVISFAEFCRSMDATERGRVVLQTPKEHIRFGQSPEVVRKTMGESEMVHLTKSGVYKPKPSRSRALGVLGKLRRPREPK
eukprot:TRINITY_DN14909_c0_g1_i4.p1 TRINITY_DN14909_c0_g1~~TRINITY_DN14909_c0_g1_i4.p1  ORF type:complete len:187 (+),score=29.69 TRINITY_DN14909_c0_g1_i4:183-743(+)